MSSLRFLCVVVIVLAKASVSSGISDNDTIVFNKCCPRNQSLIKVAESVINSERYECVASEILINIYNVLNEPLYVSENIVINDSLPNNCDELQMTQLNAADEELKAIENHCYDRLVAEVINGTTKNNIPRIVALSCNNSQLENISQQNLKIHHLRKCCPRGQSYDMEYHQCKDSSVRENMYDWFHKKIGLNDKYIYAVENGLRCKFDEYAIELTEDRFTFDIKGGTLIALGKEVEKGGKLMPGEWCVDRDYLGDRVMAQVCTKSCKNFGAFCVAKCCPPGYHFKLRRCGTYASTCVPNEDREVYFNLTSYTDPLMVTNEHLLDVMGLRIDLYCPAGRYALNSSIPLDKHWMTREGFIETSATLTNNYCLEMFDRRDCPTKDVVISALLCFLPALQTKDFRISFIIIVLSSVCLALTLFVYCALPELKNLHGRNLICHVSMMLLAFSCLARVQHSPVLDKNLCTGLGYGIYFGFVAAFAWLNVMCFDIWWTFGSVRTVKPLRKSGSDRRRFLWYSLYAWTITVLLTLTMFLLDRYPVSIVLDANIGNGACWFGTVQNTQSDWPHYIFFVVPMGLVTCTNFVLWLLTARHCAQVKSEVHRLQAGSVGDRAKRRFRIDRAKYVLTGKLWVVMGAGWISELLSTVVSEPQWLWNIVDLFNELQGVFIFLILVVKPKLYYLIKKRLGLSRAPIDPRLEKPDSQKNATSSARTSSTFLSRTISSDERSHLRTSLPNNKRS